MAEKISEYKTEKLKLMRETQPRTFGFTKGLLSALNSTVTNSIQEVTEKSATFTLSQILKKAKENFLKKYSYKLDEYLDEHKGQDVSRDDLFNYMEISIELYLRDAKVGFLEAVEKYALVDQVQQEIEIIKIANSIANPSAHKFQHNYSFDKEITDKALNENRHKMTEEQYNAAKNILESNNCVSILEGYAGSGKSTTMGTVKKVADAMGYKTIGLALPWSASQVLKNSLKAHECMAIKAFTNYIEKANGNIDAIFPQPTMIVIDEAGLIDIKTVYPLFKAISQSKFPVKVVITGDTKQLLPIGAGSMLELLVNELGSSKITEIFRQYQDSHRTMAGLFAENRAGEALHILQQQECLVWCDDNTKREQLLVRDFLSYKLANPQKMPIILASTNMEISNINKMIRKYYKTMGFIYGMETGDIMCTDTKSAPFICRYAAGDEIIIRYAGEKIKQYKIPDDKNDFDRSKYIEVGSGVFNRNFGKIVNVEKGKQGSYDLTIDLTGEIPARVIINTDEFRDEQSGYFPIVPNFATTIYSSQGQTVDKIFLVAGNSIEGKNAYVGGTRHREDISVYFDVDNIQRAMSGKDKPKLVFSKQKMLNYVAYLWSRPSENLPAIMQERLATDKKNGLLPDPKELEEERIKKRTVRQHRKDNGELLNEIDFDPFRVTVEKGDTWVSLIEKANLRQFPKINTKDQDAVDKWIKKAKDLTGLEPDYVLDEGDVIFYKPRYNKVYPILQMSSLDKMLRDDELKEAQILTDDESISVNEKLSRESIAQKMANIGKEIKVEHKENNGALFDRIMNSNFTNKQPVNTTGNFFNADTIESAIREQESKTKRTFKNLFCFRSTTDEQIIQELEEAKKSEVEKREEYLKAQEEKMVQYELERKAKLNNLTFIYPQENIAKLNRKMILEFNSKEQVPTQHFLKKSKGLYWDEGRGTPRVIALNSESEVQARYTLDGRCMVGEGFPPIMINQYAQENTNFLIVSNAKDYFYLFEKGIKDGITKGNNAVEKVPHLLWGASGVDYNNIFNKEVNENTTLNDCQFTLHINPSIKSDIDWALKTRLDLWERFGVKTMIQSSQHILDTLPPAPYQFTDEELVKFNLSGNNANSVGVVDNIEWASEIPVDAVNVSSLSYEDMEAMMQSIPDQAYYEDYYQMSSRYMDNNEYLEALADMPDDYFIGTTSNLEPPPNFQI
jgi:hypothetical protein